MEGVLVIWSKARKGVHGRAPVIILRAIASIACTRSSLVPLVLLRVALILMITL